MHIPLDLYIGGIQYYMTDKRQYHFKVNIIINTIFI